jgi:hypothetical protein
VFDLMAFQALKETCKMKPEYSDWNVSRKSRMDWYLK